MGLQGKRDDPAAIAARDGAARYCQEMEALLADRDYLAVSYSYADIAFYLALLFGVRMGARLPDALTRLGQWRERLTGPPGRQCARWSGRWRAICRRRASSCRIFWPALPHPAAPPQGDAALRLPGGSVTETSGRRSRSRWFRRRTIADNAPVTADTADRAGRQ